MGISIPIAFLQCALPYELQLTFLSSYLFIAISPKILISVCALFYVMIFSR
jgi:hypothetical protein